jgi:hypothetical protein
MFKKKIVFPLSTSIMYVYKKFQKLSVKIVLHGTCPKFKNISKTNLVL